VAILSSETLHATTVSIGGKAVLIEGASGAGKSDLALRLVDRGALLVSDDYSLVRRLGTSILATAPTTIAGKIEVRGVGIIEMPYAAQAQVALIVALGAPAARLPEPGRARQILGVDIPLLALDGHEASAPIKVELFLSQIGAPA
jgi:serine kinase of HPr protein (carbohydrate metabolism regulator)